MKKQQIQNIIPHFVQDTHPIPLSERISEFHAGIIENRLRKSTLTTEEKIKVLDMILENIKSEETQDINCPSRHTPKTASIH